MNDKLSQKLFSFEFIKNKLSTRARRALEDLGITSTQQFLALTEEEILNLWYCGKHTWHEIANLQRRLSRKIGFSPEEFFRSATKPFQQNGDDVVIMEYITQQLSTRARHAIKKLNIDGVAGFLSLKRHQVLSLKGIGKTTWQEIELIRSEIMNLQGISSPVSDPVEKASPLGSEPVSPQRLAELPFFSGISVEGITPDSLHESYMPNTSIEDLVLPPRARKALCAMKMLKVGEILLTCPQQFLRIPNFGKRSLNVIQNSLREFILGEQGFLPPSQIQYNSFEQMMHDWLKLKINNQKYILVFIYWIGIGTSNVPTFEECGKTFGITRERIRQIVCKVYAQLSVPSSRRVVKKFWDIVDYAIRSSGGIIAISALSQRITSHFKWSTTISTACLARVLKINNQLNISGGTEVTIPSQPCLNCDRIAHELCRIVSESKEIPFTNGVSSLILYCKTYCTHRNNLETFSESFLKKLIAEKPYLKDKVRLQNYYLYETDRFILRYGSVSDAAPLILKLTGESMHFTNVCRELRLWRHNNISKEQVHTALINSNDVLRWGRGVFIHRDHISCSGFLLRTIAEWVFKVLKDDIPCITIYKIYEQFCNRCQHENIPNPEALYDSLKKIKGHGLALPRYPILYRDDDIGKHIPLSILIEQWIEEQGGTVTIQEIKHFLCDKIGFKQSHLSQILSNTPNILRKDRGYIHISATGISRDRVEDLLRYGKEWVRRERHISVQKIFTEKQISCRIVGITDPRMLYSVFQLFASDEVECPGYPRLVSSDSPVHTRGIIAEVSRYIREKQSLCTYEELEKHFIQGLGYREQTIYAVVHMKDVFRYLPNCLVHASTIQWSSSKEAELLRIMQIDFEEAIRRGNPCARLDWLLEDKEYALPSLGGELSWTSTLLASIADRMPCVSVLGNAHNAYVIHPNSLSIASFGDLVGYILKTSFKGAANLNKFSDTLRKIGIVKRRLTSNMITYEDPVEIVDHEVVLKELRHHA